MACSMGVDDCLLLMMSSPLAGPASTPLLEKISTPKMKPTASTFSPLTPVSTMRVTGPATLPQQLLLLLPRFVAKLRAVALLCLLACATPQKALTPLPNPSTPTAAAVDNHVSCFDRCVTVLPLF